MSNTEKRNDEIIAETMQEFYNSLEESRKMKEQQKMEDELAALQAELDDDIVDEKDPLEEAKKAEEARRRAEARKRAAAKKAAAAKRAEAAKRAAAKKAAEEAALAEGATIVMEEINLDDIPDETKKPFDEKPMKEEDEFEVVELQEESDDSNDEENPGKGKKVKKILLTIFGSLLGILILVYAGFVIFFNSHFMFNTTVNGNDYSLKSVKDVEADMESQVQGYTLAIKEADGDTEVIDGADISLEYVQTEEISNLVSSQNKFFWPMSLWENQELETKVAVQYNEMGLENILKNLPCMDPENQVKSKNAKPEFNGTQYEIKEEIVGTQMDEGKFVEAVKAAVEGFQYELVLADTDCYKLPKYVSTSEEVIAACEKMNLYASAEIKYDFHPDTVVVDAKQISEWLRVNKDMGVRFNSDKMKEFLAELGKKYDTWGKEREFKAANGNTVKVSGGAYGWLLNEKEEYQELKKDIKSGKKVEREPVFYSYAKAVEHTNTDWGNTYAEVDLTNQRMYFIKDGQVVLESPVVTGKPSTGCATPQGVYSLTYKTRDAVLRGERDENGEPEYETPVAYWMPFNGGIGFHDATWQSSFGGSRYLTNGSHGCVNMPKNKAAELYSLIPERCPVICHY